MPLGNPYPISGTVNDVDLSLASGATVTAFNETKNTEMNEAYNATTNSDGEYTIDASDICDYDNGDVIVLLAYLESSDVNDKRTVIYRTTIDTDEGSEEKNLQLEFEDILSGVLWLLSQNWRTGSTQLRTPTFKKVFDIINFNLATGDLVTTYERQVQIRPNGAGIETRHMIYPISIDIRCTHSRSQILLMLKEIDRIINANQLNPFYGFDILEANTNWIDLSNKAKKLWRFVYDIEFEKINDVRVEDVAQNNQYITTPARQDILGSALTGTDGTKNRTYTIPGDNVRPEPVSITISGFGTHKGATLDFDRVGNTLTFKNKVWDTNNIAIHYFTY